MWIIDVLTHFGLLNELGDDHRMFFGHSYSTAQVLLQVAVTIGNVHGSSAENVGGPDQAGIPDSLTKLHRRLQEGKQQPNL